MLQNRCLRECHIVPGFRQPTLPGVTTPTPVDPSPLGSLAAASLLKETKSSSPVNGVRKTRHPIWDLFRYDDVRNISICSISQCTATLSGKYTTNLKKHLKSVHPVVYQQFAEIEKQQTLENEDPYAGNQIKFNAEMMLLVKYPHEHKKQQFFERDIATWTAGSSSIPTNVGENQDFIQMITNLDPRIDIPKRTKLSALMNDKLKQMKDLASKELMSARRATLSLDIWTKRGVTTSYLGVIITFFNYSRMMKMAITLDVKEIETATHKAEDIKREADAVIKSYGIQPTIIWRVITDAGSNMICAFKKAANLTESTEESHHDEDCMDDEEDEDSRLEVKFPCDSLLAMQEYKHMKCFIHQLLLCMKKCKNEDIIKEALDKVQKIIAKFNTSHVMTKSLIDISGKKAHSVFSDKVECNIYSLQADITSEI
ncbi:unnamed protein product [Orchesella dallaii]|uniref:BED-type domain-containing protein n=1 Tax=Orchesella dallaii TaxID=48710 RepID=A0ABP1RXT6_9HEXA